ncbi:hypothetical protein B6U99_04045 [Candidatus Geothermarchaeota archaeon ex4572_27]|nr:MAG: hypothetical protein B6U99_04045 [Candidatus Geothermarchaeota archaeon ex4572_27]
MCEFKVFLGDEVVFNDVVYAEVTERGVLLRNVVGEERLIEGCRIVKVDVGREVLRLDKA